ncbi:unnamed protein product [Lepeophtheirus salmonis]|uniref:(salmon louse) hypothetical protein n=1 Tax=Lepeophtheirus salmonis TaxID=72036 RepID=A0A7R8CIS8_LEPSM|nr:unnamed protein product [Lepeophtheirus salmonis]CAF2836108.1 unnamed protein product [Lepeophtheirus salmonis]
MVQLKNNISKYCAIPIQEELLTSSKTSTGAEKKSIIKEKKGTTPKVSANKKRVLLREILEIEEGDTTVTNIEDCKDNLFLISIIFLGCFLLYFVYVNIDWRDLTIKYS